MCENRNRSVDEMKEVLEKTQGRNAEEKEPSYVKDCKEYIASHYMEKIYVKRIAEDIHVSYSHLSRRFRETEGVTLQQYAIREKLRAAADMIRNSDRSLTEIAVSLDFASQSHMGALFKREYQMTPGEYRMRARSNAEIF